MKFESFQWIDRGGFNHYGTDRIFKIQEGTGPNILVLQGISTSSFSWAKFMDILKNDFTVFIPDFLGMGLSDKPLRYIYSIEDTLNQVVHLLKKNHVNTFHILAYGFGVELACLLIKRNLEKELKLNFLSVSLVLDEFLLHPIPMNWNPRSKQWIQIINPSSNANLESKLKSSTFENLALKKRLSLFGNYERVLSLDLIPMNLLKLDSEKDFKFLFSQLKHTSCPKRIFVPSLLTYSLNEVLLNLKKAVSKAKVTKIPSQFQYLNPEIIAQELANSLLRVNLSNKI